MTEINTVFTVIVPTCDRPAWLARCLEKLAPSTQTLDSRLYEVIVTDDGMDESTRHLVESTFQWARWIAGPRRGPAANRNQASREANGEWFVFVDDDCVPSEDLLLGYYTSIGLSVVLEGKTISDDLPPDDPRFEAPLNTTGGHLYSCNLCIKRSAFLQLRGFDERFIFWCEDMDFRRRVYEAGITAKFVESAIVNHPCRRRPTGVKLACRWSGLVDLWIAERRNVNRWMLTLHVIKIRCGDLRKMGWKADTCRQTFLTIMETVTVFFKAAAWISSSRTRFSTKNN